MLKKQDAAIRKNQKGMMAIKKEGNLMFLKISLIRPLSIFLIGLFVYPAIAQIRTVHKFKKVDIPFNLKHENLTLKKDRYDFEIIVHRTLQVWNLRIMKKGKVLCMLPGEVLRDRPPGAHGEEMSDVPEEPTLKIKRIPAKKMVYIIFETGKMETGTELLPYHKIRFKMEYELE
jgi:hypothetical protein